MKKSKLIEVLCNLKKEELEDLALFAKMPSFKLQKRDLQTLQILVQFLLKGKIDDLEARAKTVIIKEQFIKEGDSSKWNQIKSRLLKVIYSFLKFRLSRDNNESKLLLAQFFHEQKLNKNLQAFLKKTKAAIFSQAHNFDSFFYQYKFFELELIIKQPRLEEMEELHKMNRILDTFYLENKFRLLAEIQNRNNIINSLPPSSSDVNLINTLFKSTNNSFEGIIIYKLIFDLLKEGQEKDYLFAKELFFKHENRFEDDYKKAICFYLLNFCTHYFHKGFALYLRDYIDYIKYLIEEKLLIENGILSHNIYANVTTACLVVGDIEWLKLFINEYTMYLSNIDRENIMIVNLAYIDLFSNKIQDAIEKLRQVELGNNHLKIKFEKLNLKIHLELGNFELLLNRIQTFKRYLYRNGQLSNQRREKTLNFLKVITLFIEEQKMSVEDFKESISPIDLFWLKRKLSGNK